MRLGRAKPSGQKATYEIVLVPWPKTVHARDFRPVAPTAIENMDGSRFAFFEFAPESTIDAALVDRLLADALDHAASVDAVVFPEAAVHADELGELERTLAAHDVTLLIAGVRRSSGPSSFNRNYLHLGVQTAKGWIGYEQDKHHRWCLDGDQIRRYHLSRSLDPAKLRWEAVDVRERSLHVVDVGGGLITAPLVCEDLAAWMRWPTSSGASARASSWRCLWTGLSLHRDGPVATRACLPTIPARSS